MKLSSIIWANINIINWAILKTMTNTVKVQPCTEICIQCWCWSCFVVGCWSTVQSKFYIWLRILNLCNAYFVSWNVNHWNFRLYCFGWQIPTIPSAILFTHQIWSKLKLRLRLHNGYDNHLNLVEAPFNWIVVLTNNSKVPWTVFLIP